MKSDPVIGALVGVLALSALASLGLVYLYVSDARELRGVQTQVNLVNGRRMAIQSLVADALEYSKHNSDIDPLLEAIKAKPPKAAPAPANKPASK